MNKLLQISQVSDMRIEDAPMHTLLVVREGMDEEVRHTYYVRRDGSSHLSNFVPTFRVATTQGRLW